MLINRRGANFLILTLNINSNFFIRQMKTALIFFFSSFLIFSQTSDLIQPVNLSAGEEKTILVSDLFYADNYSLVFSDNKNISVQYSASSRLLTLKPEDNFEGLTLLSFSLNENQFAIPVKSEIKQKVTFSYKPEAEVTNVNLFGSFNGWNRESHPMDDKDNNGIYEITISIDPGLYEYKFFVDGEEVVDPANKEQKPNGFGGYNSVLNIPPRNSGKNYLHILRHQKNKNEIVISFQYENESDKSALDKEDVIALIDNAVLNPEQVEINKNKINVAIPAKDWNKVLRAAVNKSGQASNIQFINLKKYFSPNDFTWHDAVIYALMIDRFSDGDKSNSIPVKHPELMKPANYQGGDLQGVINKIEDGYFSKLGINTLWISPVVDNTDSAYQEYPEPHRYYTGYHGYWPVSSTKVEQRFGDFDLLKKLVETAHQKNIKVLLDFVANHIHIEHPFWKEHRDWFGELELPDGRKNLRLWDEQRLTTWFEPYMPSFDFTGSKEALEAMTDNAVWWIKESGVDGFRHDAVKHVPNEFWRMLTEKLKKEISIPQNKILYQVGETFGSYDLVSSYVNNGQLDAQFNFLLYDTALPAFLLDDGDFKNLDNEMQKTFAVYGRNNLMGNVMDSHDKVRYMAYADGDISFSDNAAEIAWSNPPEVNHDLSYEKLKLYLAYLLSIPGVPIIYYGDEIGMTGAADPDNRRMMRFDDQLKGIEKETLEEARRIINIRREHSALRQGDYQTIKTDKDTYAYLRSDLNERILIVLNKSSEAKIVTLKLPDFYNLSKASDLFLHKNYLINNSTFISEIPAVGFRIFKVE